MAIFNEADDFKDQKTYVATLKRALLGVKGETKKNFLYFKQYPFGPKKLPLVLVDVEPSFKANLYKTATKPTAEGKVGLNDQDQLDFEHDKGEMKRIQIRKHFTTLGPGLKEVFVPPGEVDPDEKPSAVKVGDQRPQPQPKAVEQESQPTQTEETLTQGLSPAMKKKLEFEEAQFKLRQRIEELKKQAVPAPLEQLKLAALKKAVQLTMGGDFKDADTVLTQLAIRMAQPISPTPPTATAQKAPQAQPKAPEPKQDAPAPSVAEQYNALKNRITAAMVPVTVGTMLFGAFKLLDDSQKKLKAAEDKFNAEIGSADKKTAEALLKAVQDELPITEELSIEATAKKSMSSLYASRAPEIRDAQVEPKGAPDWLKKPQGEFVKLVNDYKGKATKSKASEQKTLIEEIFQKLDATKETLKKWDVVVANQDTLTQAETFVKAKQTTFDDAMKTGVNEVKTALANYNKGIDGADLNGTTALFKGITDKLSPLQKLSAGRLTALNDGKTKPSVARQKAMELLKDDPAILKTIAADKNGRDFIDAMVKDMGDKVKDKDLEKDKALKGFLKDACKARYDLDKLEGDLTSKALPRLYKVLGSVPEHHTVGNKRLKAIERKRGSNEGASWYKDEENLVQLNLERTGTFRMDYEGLNMSLVSSFDTTTLHEIGHSVDAKLTFMDNNQKEATYGSWVKIKLDDVVAIAGGKNVLGAKKPFFEEWKQYPKTFLENYLKQALKRQEESAVAAMTTKAGDLEKNGAVVEAKKQRDANKPEDGKKLEPKLKKKLINDSMKKAGTKDANMTALIRKIVVKVIEGTAINEAVKNLMDSNELKDAPGNVDYKKLAKHPAVEWCHGVGLKGDHDGLWDKGKGGATKYAVEKTVYQEAYANQWWKYSVDVRGKGVSDYQFRAPGEWFSELYSAYYLKAISKSHPDHKWFTEKVHKVVPEAAVKK